MLSLMFGSREAIIHFSKHCSDVYSVVLKQRQTHRSLPSVHLLILLLFLLHLLPLHTLEHDFPF